MTDAGTLITVAGIIAAFGVGTLTFRIQRELEVAKDGGPNWIAWADWLMIAATAVSLLLVVLPLASFGAMPSGLIKLPAAACSATSILVVGYVFGILAHYRFLFWHGPVDAPRRAGEPAERIIVVVAASLAVGAFGLVVRS